MTSTNTSELSVNIPTQVSPADDPSIEREANAPIVIDNGSSTIKFGYGGDEEIDTEYPSCIFTYSPSEIDMIYSGFSRTYFRSSEKLSSDLLSLIGRYGPNFTYFGDDAIRYDPDRNRITRPIQGAVIRNWDDMESLWRYIFNKQSIDCSEHPVLLSEPVLNPKANREKSGQIMFESLNVPRFYLCAQDVLALYASGRTTGTVLCCGYDQIWSTPIYEGYSESHAVLHSKVGGRRLTEYLQSLLSTKGLAVNQDTASNIKETLCQITNGDLNQLNQTKLSAKKEIPYTLPDGKEILIPEDVTTQCGEALFDPNLVKLESNGLAELIYNSVMKLSVSIRKDLFGNIVLQGGTSLMDGLVERLRRELQLKQTNRMNLKVIAPNEVKDERKYSSWIGGSILASLSTFQEMWVTKKDYEDDGPSVIHRKCN